tara:strand:+ start:3746 stop:3925 length:180 start_codon:yes stop_codon:yes gene_type:complete
MVERDLKMAIGDSGRIVIDIDPKLKKEIHKLIKSKGLTMREWFLEQVSKDLITTNKNTK